MTDDGGDADQPADEPARTPGDGRPRRRRPWAPVFTALAGLVLLVAGVVTMAVASARANAAIGLPQRYAEHTVADEPGTLYTGSYEPVQPGDWVVPPEPVDLVGPLLILMGAVLLVFVLGWVSARRAVAVRNGRPIRELLLGAGIGLVLILAGFAVGVLAAPQRTFGWFAYAPLSDEYFASSMPDASILISLALVTAGLGVLVVTAGWWFGWLVGSGVDHLHRRRRRIAGPGGTGG